MITTLTPETRKSLFAGLALLLLLVAAALGLAGKLSLSKLDRTIAAREAQLEQTLALRDTYLDLKRRSSQLLKDLGNRPDVTPTAFLDAVASRAASRDRLVLMRPLPPTEQGTLRIESTEFRLERVSFREVLQVLWEIETASPPMKIDKLHLKQRHDSPDQLDMNATVSAPRSPR